mmetsp:Transcript_108649/g.350744  ORF Transcript_108649/g.350744 Transcript_108649/m.350744 type:complete len:406 (+) Transcript_108649:11-1228(+)
MAPKAAGKRAAREAAAPPAAAKKPRADPMLRAVEEAVRRAEGLPESCREMLLAMAPLALGAPCDERHEVQRAAVEIIGEVMRGIESQHQAGLDARQAQVDEIQGSKGTLELAAVEAQAHLEDATRMTDTCKDALAATTETVSAAKAAVTEKHEAQQRDNAAHMQVVDAKEALEKAINVDLGAIKEGCQGEAHYNALQPVLQGLGLDESLVAALPATCAKAPGDRAPFDTMVLEALDKGLREKAASLAQQLQEGAAAAQARAEAVEAANNHLATAISMHQEAEEALATAEARRAEAAAGAEAAAAAVDSHEPEYQAAVKARDQQAAALDSFRGYELACFELLRDQLSKKAKDAAKQEAKAAAQEAAKDATQEATTDTAEGSAQDAVATGSVLPEAAVEVPVQVDAA